MDPYHQEYQNAYREARRAELVGNFRLAADKFWQAYRMAPDGVWTKYRFHCLRGYMKILADKVGVAKKKDYKNLETRIANNDDEPNIFRAHAALCLGLMYYHDTTDCDQAAECFRHCIDLCDSASPEEKERVEEHIVLADEPPRARQLSELFDELKEIALKALRTMERNDVFEEPVGVHDPVHSPWSAYPRSMLVPIFGDIPTAQMERRLVPGGARCDCCGVARGSTDRKCLLVCGKCTMAYYCSKECQVEQWKHRGHKQACRKPREFHPKDVVRYVSEDLRSTCPLRLKHLVDVQDGDGTFKWEVCCATDGGEVFLDVVEESKLRHIRPADIV